MRGRASCTQYPWATELLQSILKFSCLRVRDWQSVKLHFICQCNSEFWECFIFLCGVGPISGSSGWLQTPVITKTVLELLPDPAASVSWVLGICSHAAKSGKFRLLYAYTPRVSVSLVLTNRFEFVSYCSVSMSLPVVSLLLIICIIMHRQIW